MFSVIIPLYNKELSISNTIQSVLDQTFQDFEIVIVNDGSTDKSVGEVEKFDDKRIRLIHQENQGVSSARNRGIEEAKYEWIAFLDGDDLWMENHLETLRDMICKHPNDKVFTTSFIRNLELRDDNFGDKSIVIVENYFKDAIKLKVTWTSIICLNKEVFNNIGLFNSMFVRGEDIDLWSRIGRNYRYIKSNLITAIYREDAENRSDIRYVSVRKTFAGHIKLNMSESVHEKDYYMYFIMNSFKSAILNKQWKDIYYMLLKYNVHLLKRKK